MYIGIGKLDILDEEAGWQNVDVIVLDKNTHAYIITTNMFNFSYGFYNFAAFGTAVSISPPFVL